MTHTCMPGHPGILADGCDRCGQLAADPLGLDSEKVEALWNLMVEVEGGGRNGRPYPSRGYETGAEARACQTLYRAGVFAQRHLGLNEFFVPLDRLKAIVRLAGPVMTKDEMNEALGLDR